MVVNRSATRALLLVLFISGFFLTQAQDSSNTGSYTLQQCIDYALENHEKIKKAHLDISIAQQKIVETRSVGLPQANGKIEYTGTLSPMAQFFPAKGDPPFGDPNAPDDAVASLAFGVNHAIIASATVSQIIFDGGYLVGLQSSKTYKELFEKSLDQTKTEVVEQVIKAYYGALVTSERIKLLEINLKRLEALEKDTRTIVEAGLAQKLDLSRVTVNKNNIRTELLKLRALDKITTDLLKFQMGMPVSNEIVLAETLETYISEFQASAGDVNFEARPEYRTLMVQQSLNENELKFRKVIRYPRLSAFFNGGYNVGQIEAANLFNFDEYMNFGMVGFNLNFPILSSGQSSSQIKQAQLNIEKTAEDISMLKKSIEFELRQNQIKYNNNLMTLEFQEENIALAEEVFNDAKIKYDAGVGSNLEVIDAESSLKEAQVNYLAAVYDLLISKTDLDKANGTLITQ